MDALSLQIDTQQSRVKAKAVFTLVDPDNWDTTLGDGNCALVRLDNDQDSPRMAILKPRCKESSWYTSTTSPYDKLGVSDFTGLTGASWGVQDKTGTGGGKYLTAILSAGYAEAGKTSATIGQNRGVVLEFFAPGEGADYEVLRFGYASTAAYTSGIGFRFYSGGSLEVYKNGTFLQKVDLYGTQKVVAGEYIELILLPCRKREIIVVSNKGGRARIVFEDVDISVNEPEIVPDTSFWFQFQNSVAPVIQIAAMKFATSGTVYGLKSAFKRGPSASAVAQTFTNSIFSSVTNALIYGHRQKSGSANNDVTTATLRDGTDSGAFTPNGSNKDCRIKLTLTGSGSYTPTVYGALMGYVCEKANTANSPTSLDLYLRRASLAVPEDPARVEIRGMLKSPAAIEAAGATKLRTIAHRPIKAKFGSNVWFDGFSTDHDWEDGEQDEVRHFSMSIRDRWKVWERMIIDDPIPLDGLTFNKALELLLSYGGLTSADWDIEATTTKIENVPDEGWNLQVEEGDTVAVWVKRLFETYAPHWFYGLKPVDNGSGGLKIIFHAKSPTALGVTPKTTLYPTIAAATTAYDAARARRYVWQSFSEYIAEPESNELYVSGRNPATGQKIITARRDLDSIDPTKAVSARPDNWVGDVLTVGYMDTSLTSDAALTEAADYLEDKLFVSRRLPHWNCEMLFYTGASGAQVPVWTGDVVRLHDVAAIVGTTDYRILNFDGEFQFEPADASNLNGQIRPFSYAGEEV